MGEIWSFYLLTLGHFVLSNLAIMTRDELQQHLFRLKLSPEDAAALLDVAPRTLRRWLIEGDAMPGPAEQAILAWVRLHDAHLAWRPDTTALLSNDESQIALHRAHAVALAEMLARVEARGGPKVTWDVDLSTNTATLGPLNVSFYRLQNGSFSLAHYRRADEHPDPVRDADLIDDAAYCISKALKKLDPAFGPVTVFSQDGPAKNRTAKQQLQHFKNIGDALLYVCRNLGNDGFHDPFITTEAPAELLWDHHELKRQCAGMSIAPTALATLAGYVDAHAHMFVRHGPNMLSPQESAKREQNIRAVASQIANLGRKATVQIVPYPEFDRLLRQLHALGFFPPMENISEIAGALEHR